MNRTPRELAARVIQGSARVGSPTRAEVALTIGGFAAAVALSVIPWHQGADTVALMVRTLVLVGLVLPWRTWAPSVVLVAVAGIELWHVASIAAIAGDAPDGLSIALYLPAPVGTMLAAYTLGRRASRVRAWVLASAAGLALAIAAHAWGAAPEPGVDVLMLNTIVLATGIGVALDARAARLAHKEAWREEERRRAVEDERLRIARELHDVLAHNLTLVNAQASVAEYLLPTDAEAAAKALHGVSVHTRQALEEVRATIGVLRSGDEDEGEGGGEGLRPAPTLSRVDELVRDHEAGGGAVTLQTRGVPGHLSASADAAGYRIVQEALTNARKHAPGLPVSIEIEWDVDAVRVAVTNPVSQEQPAATSGGFGLVGMAERARAAGGSLTTGLRPRIGFVVEVRLPRAKEEES
ncbi:sensor histidine kinase [Demequina zhanjiangensis]|uniref:histidine kinase n=1 Tax=Demequina zhanjiangensis TaxID=3051659 RepID=A0ABT8G191_9MICO|nr:histidine kinase [Demequina sp. SYSU T00b26]MDN4472900.1 histidine kinase [Demequina sp. SYSU T00b26]